jgi:hypothetical protein
MIPIAEPTAHQKTVTHEFAAWYVKRHNEGMSPGSIRRATITVWAEANDIDLSLEDTDYIFANYQDLITVQKH